MEGSRSPYGERGLKLFVKSGRDPQDPSLSLRRAWIEIGDGLEQAAVVACRSPYGERGLKYVQGGCRDRNSRSLSLRRAWIEICRQASAPPHHASLSLRRAWIEMYRDTPRMPTLAGRSPYGERGLKYHRRPDGRRQAQSLSLRRAWIEIFARAMASVRRNVALLTESVD